jgi:hypothetical protein
MRLLHLVFAAIAVVTPTLPSRAEDPIKVQAPAPEKKSARPVVRNFMVTECTKKTGCLMKMRPHEKILAKDGSITWRKIQ